MILALVFGSIFVSMRIAGVVHPAFQAFAHIYVGMLIMNGLWRLNLCETLTRDRETGLAKWKCYFEDNCFLWLAALVSLIELMVALGQRGILHQIANSIQSMF